MALQIIVGVKKRKPTIHPSLDSFGLGAPEPERPSRSQTHVARSSNPQQLETAEVWRPSLEGFAASGRGSSSLGAHLARVEYTEDVRQELFWRVAVRAAR